MVYTYYRLGTNHIPEDIGSLYTKQNLIKHTFFWARGLWVANFLWPRTPVLYCQVHLLAMVNIYIYTYTHTIWRRHSSTTYVGYIYNKKPYSHILSTLYLFSESFQGHDHRQSYSCMHMWSTNLNFAKQHWTSSIAILLDGFIVEAQ